VKSEERRENLIRILSDNEKPVSGGSLSDQLDVSRQVIVQDIAILRAHGYQIFSTNRGYYLQDVHALTRVFKVCHDASKIEEELNLIVDLGGRVLDVFVYHKVYGVVKVDLKIKSRLDIKNYLAQIKDAKSKPLLTITSGYHYHTVNADSVEILDLIQEKLADAGFLANLTDYEPVDFWKE